jgi:hypothetical protein
MDYYVDRDGDQVQVMHLSEELVATAVVWTRGLLVEEIDPLDDTKRQPGINLVCGTDVKRASLGDYILKHSDGVFDVKKPGEFKRSHVPSEA